MPNTLPPDTTLDKHNQAAKALSRSFGNGDSDAIARVHQHLPQVKNLSRDEVRDFPLTLMQAQTVIAREYGMKSWEELRLAIKLKQRDFGTALKRFKQSIYARDAEKLDELLRAHPELRDTLDDPHFDFGSTAVIIAKNSLDVVDVLLRHGADINAKSQWWAGDFHVLEGTPNDLAKALVERGAEVTVHAAAEQGWLDWLEQAWQKNKSIVQLRGGDGKTPLHYASDAAVMDWLLQRGADLEVRDLDHQGTPLQWMIGEHKYDAARELLKRGAQVDIFAAVVLCDLELVKRALAEYPHAVRARVNLAGYELTPVADGSHQYVYAFSGAGMSPHQIALLFGQEEIFNYLVEHSPPDVQLLAYCARGDAANAQRLAAEHPKIVSQLSDADQRQLIVAAASGDIEAVRVMVSLGFKLHIRDDDAMTPLHWAAFHGYDKVIEVLLAADDEPPLTWLNGYGGTPLTTCLYGNQHTWRTGGDHAASLQLLVDAGSEVKAKWLPTGNDAFDEIFRNALT